MEQSEQHATSPEHPTYTRTPTLFVSVFDLLSSKVKHLPFISILMSPLHKCNSLEKAEASGTHSSPRRRQPKKARDMAASIKVRSNLSFSVDSIFLRIGKVIGNFRMGCGDCRTAPFKASRTLSISVGYVLPENTCKLLTAARYTRILDPESPSSYKYPMYKSSVSSVTGMTINLYNSQNLMNRDWAEE
jgi:hypothetical protein